MKVFISYAREDIDTARKLYHDLKQAGITPWMDKEDILIGENWKIAIRQAMKESSYFLALLSSNSLSKQGYVQKELKMALDILAEMPPSGIFLLPIRLDDCNPLDERLQDINWGNLFPSYEEGLNQILRVLKKDMPEKQEIKSPSKPVQPILQPKIPTWLTVIVLSAIIIAGIIKFYPFEKQIRSDFSLRAAVPASTSEPDPPVVVTPPPLKPPDKEFTNSLGMKFVKIPAGSFTMGSPKDEPGRDDDETQHGVTISKPFFMQTTEITIGHWRAFVKETGYKSEAEKGDGAYVWTGSEWKKDKNANWNNPGFGQTEKSPVTCVSWNDAQEFVKWLNGKGEGTYRLPTEAEWEYAARAGSTTAFANGGISETECGNDPNLSRIGWYCGNAERKTHEVGQKSPNDWGLYDMHGNVWEWCQDRKDAYPSGAVTDFTGPSFRVLRGGSWRNDARYCRSASRGSYSHGYRDGNRGFRLVRS